MFLLLFNIVCAQLCEQSLDLIIKDHLIPRIRLFNSEGKGLDYLGEYPECFNNNRTYAAIFWKQNYLPCSSYGFCIPQACENEDFDNILNRLSSFYKLPEQIR